MAFCLSYVIILSVMANTMSAKKNIRSSARKKAHNQMWKNRVKDSAKNIKDDLAKKITTNDLVKKLQLLRKAVDKAAKNKVIHKNRANRLKSKYARKISALLSTTAKGSK